MNIWRSFQEDSGKGAAGPAFAFKQLMRSISQVKTNIENLLKNHFAASLKELEMNVNELISAIAGSISKDLMALLEPQVSLILSGKRPIFKAGEIANLKVAESFQTALFLITNFA